MIGDFEADYCGTEQEHPRFVPVTATGSVLDEAARLCGAHGLRAYDAIQLASALATRRADASCDTIAVFDTSLRRAAVVEGMTPGPVRLDGTMLIHPWDQASKDEWQQVLHTVDFGQLVAAGREHEYPVVVPTHFLYDGADEIWLHLARPNPVWRAIEENPHVVLAVIADYTYVEAAWNADDGVPPERGVPTSYYTGVQFRCRAEIVDDPGGKFAILAAQLRHLEPEGSSRVPPSSEIETDRRLLPGIRGLRLSIETVQSKMKYGGNKSTATRARIADHLAARDGPGDPAARTHLLRRSRPTG